MASPEKKKKKKKKKSSVGCTSHLASIF